MGLNTDSEFTLYLLCAFLITFVHPWIPHATRAYQHYFTTTTTDATTWWTTPPNVKTLSLLLLASNTCIAISAINYLYVNRNPAAGSQDADYYISLEALWLAVIAFKSLWHYILLTYYKSRVALVVAFCAAVTLALILLGVLILLSVRAQWLSLGFLLPVMLLYCVCVPRWTHAILTRQRETVAVQQ